MENMGKIFFVMLLSCTCAAAQINFEVKNASKLYDVQIEDIRDFDLDRFRKWRGVVTVHIQDVLGVLTSFKSVPSGST